MIAETRVYRGPNVHSRDRAIALLLDADREVAQAVAGATLHLQREAGGHHLRADVHAAGDKHRVVYTYADEQVGLAAGRLAVRMVSEEPGLDLDRETEDLLLLADRTAFGPSTQALIDEATLRDVPWLRLNEGSLVQLGQGIHAKRIRATMTSRTSALATDVAGDKELTLRLLAAAGLPVPSSESVRDADDAVAVAKRIGYPVVVKPLDGNHGRGVALDLRDDAAVRNAFPVAQREARRGRVLVETYENGNDYRFLIVGGRMVAAAERVPAHVVGDGVHTVAELVAQTNADPRRGVGHEKVLTRIRLDDKAAALVREQGYDLDAVPPAGVTVALTLTANMSTGGVSIDRTAEAHPDNVEIAEEAAQVVGLDVAGIDFVAADITESVRDAGGAIVEVNAAPGFRMHTHPTVGEPQYVAKPVLDLLFPPGTPSRIPIVAVTGTNGKTTTARMIAHVLKGMGRTVGMTSTDGILVDERLVIRADASGPKSARMVLQNPRVDTAVFEVARGGILREGLGYERNDVAVVVNVAADHLGIGGVETLEDLARVKRVVVEAVPRDGYAVLNADDPLVAAMREACAGRVVWFSMQPGNPLVEEHCAGGGDAVVLDRSERGDLVVIRSGRRSMELAWTHLLPATFDGRAMMNVQNALAAAGAAFALGAHLHDIRLGLRTFTTSFYLAPGRLNVTDIDGVRVVVDYCHNAPGMRMLGDFVERMAEPGPGAPIEKVRRIGVIATAGDRRDDDMRDLGVAAAPHFDAIVVREDVNLRRRAPGETAALVADGVRGAEVSRCVDLEIVPEELAATRRALEKANPGDLVVLCVDRAGEVWAELQAHTRRALAGAADPDARP